MSSHESAHVSLALALWQMGWWALASLKEAIPLRDMLEFGHCSRWGVGGWVRGDGGGGTALRNSLIIVFTMWLDSVLMTCLFEDFAIGRM